MAVNRGLFVRATGDAPNKVGTTPIESRLALAGLLAENTAGVPRQGLLTPPNFAQVAGETTSMTYYVQPFQAVLVRAANEGAYILSTSGITAVATDPSPATGSRWDILYIKQNDTDKGDPDNLPVMDVAKGTAATSPTKPAIPTGAYALAEARIYAGTGGTTGGSNTLTPLYSYTAARGGIIPIKDVTDRNTLGAPYLGQQIIRLDRHNHIQTYTGTTTPASGWEWLGVPRRYWADTLTFSSTASAASRLIGEIVSHPIRSYATKARLNARLPVSCSTIANGILAVSVNVSLNQSQVQNAQQKARLSFTPPGGYWLTANVETDWLAIGAGGSGLPRIWIEHLSGAVNQSSTATAVYAHFWMDVLPADD